MFVASSTINGRGLLDCFYVVLFDTMTIVVHDTKVVLRHCKPLRGHFSVPLDCLLVVLFHTLTFGVLDTKVEQATPTSPTEPRSGQVTPYILK